MQYSQLLLPLINLQAYTYVVQPTKVQLSYSLGVSQYITSHWRITIYERSHAVA